MVRKNRVMTLNLDRAIPNEMIFLEEETQSEITEVGNSGRIQS